MKLRKEQTLFLATGALLALLVVLGGGSESKQTRASARAADYEANELGAMVVTDALTADATAARDLFLKPSLTRPLPPLDIPSLPLPPFPDLPLLEPPLRPGPVLSHWHALRVAPKRVTLPTDGQTGGDATDSEPTSPTGLVPGPSAESSRGTFQGDSGSEHALTYDRLVFTEGGDAYWGKVVDKNKYAFGRPAADQMLAVQAPFREPVRFTRIDPVKGTVLMNEVTIDPERVARIEFANTIHNRIGMRRRRIAPGDAGLPDREAFIRDLLTVEREHPEALEQAEIQAIEYLAIGPKSARGHELKALVYSSTGQLEKELAVYDELSQSDFRAHSFVVRGRGVLAQRLGLYEDAERDLREATRLDATDAENWLALSRLLLERGQGAESAAAARKAVDLIDPAVPKAEEAELRMHLVHALLATGQDDEAQRALTAAENVGLEVPDLALLKGCTLYARKAYGEALAAFQAAAAALPESAMALIGAGLCRYHQDAHDEAMALFRNAAQRDPLERHIALAAQAFLYLQADGRATEAVQRCEDAERIAPRDSYVLYLLGRSQRQAGQLAQARGAFDRALRDQHDFVEAMAEKAYVHLLEARQGAGELLVDGERLAARAVQVDAERGKSAVFQDLLGVLRYHLRKNEAARRAFETAKEWGSTMHADIWLALLRNRLGHVDDAVSLLRKTWQFIREPEDPFKVYADATMKMLQYHRGKQLFQDDFVARQKVWDTEKRGQPSLNWRPHDGVLKIAGKAKGEDRTYQRLKVAPGRSLVDVRVKLAVGNDNNGNVLLRLTDERLAGAGRTSESFLLRVGHALGNAYLYLRDGTTETEKNKIEMREPEIGAPLRNGESVELRVRIDRGIDGSAQQATVIVDWNGREILRRECRSLGSMQSRDLWIDLLVEPQSGQPVDATFDDFRLIRLGKE